MINYYNDVDPYCCDWTRNLIREGLLPDGRVDERDILDVRAGELADYAQCHFFSGIAGWSEALRLADWPSDRPVWTASCPCPPFSVAGRKTCPDCQSGNLGFWSGRRSVIEFFGCRDCRRTDNRNLWPDFYVLLRESRPDLVFGEQVDSPLGRVWLAGVQTDLERADYTFGTAGLCAAGVAAPHIRQRNYWVAVAKYTERRPEPEIHRGAHGRPGSGGSGQPERMGVPAEPGLLPGALPGVHPGEEGDGSRDAELERRGDPERLVFADGGGCKAGRNGSAAMGHGRPADAAGRPGGMGDAVNEGLQERERDRGIQPGAMGSSKGQAVERGSDAERMVQPEVEQMGLPGLARERRASSDGGVADSGQFGSAGRRESRIVDEAAGATEIREEERQWMRDSADNGGADDFWADCDLIPCIDGTTRRTISSTQLMDAGFSPEVAILCPSKTFKARTEILKGAGNSIVPQVAAEFIRAFLES